MSKKWLYHPLAPKSCQSMERQHGKAEMKKPNRLLLAHGMTQSPGSVSPWNLPVID